MSNLSEKTRFVEMCRMNVREAFLRRDQAKNKVDEEKARHTSALEILCKNIELEEIEITRAETNLKFYEADAERGFDA
jgi:hypothetical protein